MVDGAYTHTHTHTHADSAAPQRLERVAALCARAQDGRLRHRVGAGFARGETGGQGLRPLAARDAVPTRRRSRLGRQRAHARGRSARDRANVPPCTLADSLLCGRSQRHGGGAIRMGVAAPGQVHARANLCSLCDQRVPRPQGLAARVCASSARVSRAVHARLCVPSKPRVALFAPARATPPSVVGDACGQRRTATADAGTDTVVYTHPKPHGRGTGRGGRCRWRAHPAVRSADGRPTHGHPDTKTSLIRLYDWNVYTIAVETPHTDSRSAGQSATTFPRINNC